MAMTMDYGNCECGQNSVEMSTLRMFHRNDFLFDVHRPYVVERKRMVKSHLSRFRLRIKGFRYY